MNKKTIAHAHIHRQIKTLLHRFNKQTKSALLSVIFRKTIFTGISDVVMRIRVFMHSSGQHRIDTKCFSSNHQ